MEVLHQMAKNNRYSKILFPKSVKGHIFIKKSYRMMIPALLVALVMVNKYVNICVNFGLR